MKSGTMSDKGQLTIPSELRQKAQLHPGARVEFEWRDGEIVIHPLKTVRELGGIFAEYAVGKGTDFERIREEAMEKAAAEIVSEGHD